MSVSSRDVGSFEVITGSLSAQYRDCPICGKVVAAEHGLRIRLPSAEHASGWLAFYHPACLLALTCHLPYGHDLDIIRESAIRWGEYELDREVPSCPDAPSVEVPF